MEQKRKQHLSESQLERVVGGVSNSPSYSESRGYRVLTGSSLQISGTSPTFVYAMRGTTSSANHVAMFVGGPNVGWDFADGTPTKAWVNSFGADAAAAFKSRYTSYVQPLTGVAWPGWGNASAILAK